MTMGPLGQLNNAPLAYVLGAINFDFQTALDVNIPYLQIAFQEAGFPRYKRVKHATVQFTGGEESASFSTNVHHEFASADNHTGIILSSDTLVFHATTYTKYEDFDKTLTNVLEIVSRKLKYLMINRVGLRYIDLIVPKPDESPDVYISPSLRCLAPLSIATKTKSGLAITEFEMEKGTMVVRLIIGQGNQALSPDFQTLSLSKPAIFQNVTDNDMCASLDFDRFVMHTELFDLKQIRDLFFQLHQDHSQAFRELTTPYAMKVWHPEKNI